MPTIAETLAQATALRRAGRLPDAEACYRRVVDADPKHAEAHYLLGVVLAQMAKWDQAAACFRRAVELKSDYANAHNNLGLVLATQEKLDEAVACFRRALELKGDSAEVHNNLGSLLERQGKLDEAVACCRRAIELKSDYAGAHNNLGTVLASQEKLDEAVAAYRRALELKNDYAGAHNNLGAALGRQEKWDEALACYRRAVELKPDYSEAHFNQAITLLLLGRFAEAWPEFEWRATGMQLQRYLQRPRWTGTNLAGGTILLPSEQGLGDTLQFIRYAERVKQHCARVVVECQPQLARLLESCSGVDRVVARGEPLPKFDVYASLMSLPGIFRASPENIPARVPYLRPSGPLIEFWKNELAGGGLKVGIAWQGSPGNKLDRFRSIPLAHFAGIAATPGVRVYSLQMGPGREQLATAAGSWPIVDLGDRLGDFESTAAIMLNLDLVITCDSAPVHLAGALGVPVWVALAYAPDWRWMLGRNDSPWYPTLRLFRQPRPGDWKAVFANMQAELIRMV